VHGKIFGLLIVPVVVPDDLVEDVTLVDPPNSPAAIGRIRRWNISLAAVRPSTTIMRRRMKQAKDFTVHRYHQPSDEYSPDMILRATP